MNFQANCMVNLPTQKYPCTLGDWCGCRPAQLKTTHAEITFAIREIQTRSIQGTRDHLTRTLGLLQQHCRSGLLQQQRHKSTQRIASINTVANSSLNVSS